MHMASRPARRDAHAMAVALAQAVARLERDRAARGLGVPLEVLQQVEIGSYLDTIIRTLGDVPGHDFHGNQWTTAPAQTKVGQRIVDGIFGSGAGSDYVHHLYGSDPNDLIAGDLDLNTVRDADIEYARSVVQERSQEALRAKYGDTVTAYRGTTGTEGKNDTISLTLSEHTAKFHAGRRTTGGQVLTFQIPVSKVLSYSEAIGRGTFAEQEILVPYSVLKALRTAGEADGHPFHGNQYTKAGIRLKREALFAEYTRLRQAGLPTGNVLAKISILTHPRGPSDAGEFVVVNSKPLKVVQSANAQKHGDTLVLLDTQKLDAAWQRDVGFHIAPGGTGEGSIQGRTERLDAFLQVSDVLDAGEVTVGPTGRVSFGNGRHRTAYLRDHGVNAIPVSMDAQSLAYAREHGLVASRSVAGDLRARIVEAGAYHGTVADVVARVRTDGLLPGGSAGADAAVGFNRRAGGPSVFLTSSYADAYSYADTVARARGLAPIVLKIRVPADQAHRLVLDEQHLGSMRIEGRIPPEWIESVSTHETWDKDAQHWRTLSGSVYAVIFADNMRTAEAFLRDLGDVEGHVFHGNQYQDVAGNVLTRPELIVKLKALKEEMRAKFAGKEDLTALEAREYERLATEIQSLQFHVARPLTLEKVPDQTALNSTLAPETVMAAQHDLIRDKNIYMAVASAAAGTHWSADTALDTIMRGKNPHVSPAQLRTAFDATRAALRAQFGDTITLFRVHGRQPAKPTQNWATTEAEARQYGRVVTKQTFPIERVLLVNVGHTGKYHEVVLDMLRTLGEADGHPFHGNQYTDAFGTSDPYVYHITRSGSDLHSFRRQGIKPSEEGYGGAGVYMANTPEATQYYEDLASGQLLRIDKAQLIHKFGLYPASPRGIEFDEHTGEVMLSGDRPVPPEMIQAKIRGQWRPLTWLKDTPVRRVLGEAEGHPFHGNQYTDVAGGKLDYTFPKASEDPAGPSGRYFYHSAPLSRLTDIQEQGIVQHGGAISLSPHLDSVHTWGGLIPREAGDTSVLLRARRRDVRARYPGDPIEEYDDEGNENPEYDPENPDRTTEYDPRDAGAELATYRDIPAEHLEVYTNGKWVPLKTLRAAGEKEGHPFRGNQWTKLGASLKSTTSYKKDRFYGSEADMQAIAAKIPGSKVVRQGTYYHVVNEQGQPFGPKGFTGDADEIAAHNLKYDHDGKLRSERSRRALEAHVPGDRKTQKWGLKGEELIVEELAAEHIGGLAPVDVVTHYEKGTQGLEVKSLINQKNDKITMRKDALGRKRRWSRKNGGPVHTVVVDWRDQSHKDPKTYSGHRIYFHAGVGSFRLDSMVPVKNARHLRDLIEEATP